MNKSSHNIAAIEQKAQLTDWQIKYSPPLPKQ